MRIRQYLWLTLKFIGAKIPGFGTHERRRGVFAPTEIMLTEVPQMNLMELVTERLTFVDSHGVKWTALKGTWTDGATVPRFALPITDGRFQKEFLKAAVIHDAYCQEFNAQRCPDQYQKKSWKQVHHMFFEACVAGGTSTIKAKLMFAAVWLGGPRWSDPDTYRQQVSDDMLLRAFGGCKNRIEQDDLTVDEIVADINGRERLLAELYQFESQSLSAFADANWMKAAQLLQQEETLLTQALGKLPDDLMLLNFRGYLHKNKAILRRDSEGKESVDEELGAAEMDFHSVIKMNPKDPSALNGLGSVSILRGDLGTAETYVRKAIEIAPDYQAAKHDLDLIDSLRRAAAPPP